jgi:hypothetical protein
VGGAAWGRRRCAGGPRVTRWRRGPGGGARVAGPTASLVACYHPWRKRKRRRRAPALPAPRQLPPGSGLPRPRRGAGSPSQGTAAGASAARAGPARAAQNAGAAVRGARRRRPTALTAPSAYHAIPAPRFPLARAGRASQRGGRRVAVSFRSRVSGASVAGIAWGGTQSTRPSFLGAALGHAPRRAGSGAAWRQPAPRHRHRPEPALASPMAPLPVPAVHAAPLPRTDAVFTGQVPVWGVGVAAAPPSERGPRARPPWRGSGATTGTCRHACRQVRRWVAGRWVACRVHRAVGVFAAGWRLQGRLGAGPRVGAADGRRRAGAVSSRVGGGKGSRRARQGGARRAGGAASLPGARPRAQRPQGAGRAARGPRVSDVGRHKGRGRAGLRTSYEAKCRAGSLAGASAAVQPAMGRVGGLRSQPGGEGADWRRVGRAMVQG